jgi:hypothetical protein
MRKLYSIAVLCLISIACSKPKTLPGPDKVEVTSAVISEKLSGQLTGKATLLKETAFIISDEAILPPAPTPSLTVTAEAPKSITITVPKKEVIDEFTQVKYAQIGVLVIYDKTMKVGKDYSVGVKVFRGTLTETPKDSSVTMFTGMAAKNVGILLESDAFRITSSETVIQTLLPENIANTWLFTVTPIKVGEQVLNVKLGTSDNDHLSFKDPDIKPVVVTSSFGIIRAKLILFKEHYIKNQLFYNALGGIIVFLSGFIVIKKKRKS